MRRAPGWIRLAGIALELGALAFLGYVVMAREDSGYASPSMPQDATPAVPDESPAAHVDSPAAEKDTPDPLQFISDAGDRGARYYRAADDGMEIIAGFYSDGRVRLSDAQNRRFAGMLDGPHADLLDLENNQWSEVFLRETPGGQIQLELRGGPYDAHVLTCEPFVI